MYNFIIILKIKVLDILLKKGLYIKVFGEYKSLATNPMPYKHNNTSLKAKGDIKINWQSDTEENNQIFDEKIDNSFSLEIIQINDLNVNNSIWCFVNFYRKKKFIYR